MNDDVKIFRIIIKGTAVKCVIDSIEINVKNPFAGVCTRAYECRLLDYRRDNIMCVVVISIKLNVF